MYELPVSKGKQSMNKMMKKIEAYNKVQNGTGSDHNNIIDDYSIADSKESGSVLGLKHK